MLTIETKKLEISDKLNRKVEMYVDLQIPKQILKMGV